MRASELTLPTNGNLGAIALGLIAAPTLAWAGRWLSAQAQG